MTARLARSRAWRRAPGATELVAGADGTELLQHAGVIVIELPEYASVAKEPNRHLL